MKRYTSEQNTKAITQLNRLTIAKITSGKRVNKEGYTNNQLLNIQRLANRLNKEKDFVIAYR